MRRIVLNLRDTRSLWAIPGWAVEEIRDALPDGWEIVDVDAAADGRGDGGGVAEDALAAVVGAEIYIGYGAPREVFLAATAAPGSRLRWMHSAAAGVGGSLYPEMLSADVLLTNSAGIHAAPIAETVLAMVLHFARGLDHAVRAQAQQRWLKAPFDASDTQVREISGGTLGIVGFGGIGREIAWRAAVLGMRVLATRRTRAPAPAHVKLVTGEQALQRLAEQSDYLVVAVPETKQTRELIDEPTLRRLPPSAVVINVARGGVLDEQALLRMLQEGRLRGAGLDVFREEPLPPESPFWSLPNVLVTPHVAGTTPRFWRRETDLIVANLRRYLAGEPLVNEVDKHAGY